MFVNPIVIQGFDTKFVFFDFRKIRLGLGSGQTPLVPAGSSPMVVASDGAAFFGPLEQGVQLQIEKNHILELIVFLFQFALF